MIMIGRVMPVHMTRAALTLIAGVMGMPMIGNLGSKLGVPLGLGGEHCDRAVADRRVGDGQQHRRRRQAEHHQRQKAWARAAEHERVRKNP